MRARCPNCGRGFNCDGGEDWWCLKGERNFDYEEMILRTGAMGCACPVCVTGRTDLADVEKYDGIRKKLFAKLLTLQTETGDTLDLKAVYPKLCEG